MDELDIFLKPQIDQLKEVYRLGYEAGRRARERELAPEIERLRESQGKPIFLNKNEGAEPSQKRQEN